MGELFHEVDQGDGAGLGEGVVHAGAHAGGDAVAGQAGEAVLFGFGGEEGVEFGGGALEGDVHERAGVGLGVGLVEVLAVEEVVDDGGLLLVALLHGLEAALGEDPLEDLAHQIDAEGVGGVEAALGLGVVFVLDHLGQGAGAEFEDVLAGDEQGDAGGAEVLLGAGVDQAVLGDIDGAGEDVGGGVGDKEGSGGDVLRLAAPFGADDGVVGGELHIDGVG